MAKSSYRAQFMFLNGLDNEVKYIDKKADYDSSYRFHGQTVISVKDLAKWVKKNDSIIVTPKRGIENTVNILRKLTDNIFVVSDYCQ